MTNDDIFPPKSATLLHCIICDLKCSKKGDYMRHILTAKHLKNAKKMTNDDKMMTNLHQITPNYIKPYFECDCGKEYAYRRGLSFHKKKCIKQNIVSKKEPDLTDKDIIKMLINENSEFKNMILEVVKSVQPSNNNTINNNNNSNNTFNIQLYLNDTCKDAVNFYDFVDSLQVKLKDLEVTAQLGYSEGVSRIFINGLNELDASKRPIHCSDVKRETLYIKEQNEWSKEDSNKSHLSKAIKMVNKKNIEQIFEWQKKYPEYNDPASKQSDRYMEMICNIMPSSGTEQEKNMNKIIKNITKEVVIDKNV